MKQISEVPYRALQGSEAKLYYPALLWYWDERAVQLRDRIRELEGYLKGKR